MLKLLLLVVALVATAATIASATAPRGFMTYFDASSCPDGWSEVPSAQGRLIVSVADATDAGLTINEPLKDREDRGHTHSTKLAGSLEFLHIAGASGGNHQSALHGGVSTSFSSNSGASGLPFSQYLLCRATGNPIPSGGNATSSQLAMGVVGFFSPETPKCPSGWRSYEGLTGRIAVPGFDEGGPVPNRASPLSTANGVLEDRVHVHSASVPVHEQSVSFVGIDGCCNDGPARFDSGFKVRGSADNHSSELPMMTLLTCVSEQQSLQAELPPGALLFTEMRCPVGWGTYDAAAGRMLVALPAGGMPGASFGGSSLSPMGAPVGHQHNLNSTINFPSVGIELGSGCCAGGYAGAGNFAVAGDTDMSDVNLPWTMMTMCGQTGMINNGKDKKRRVMDQLLRRRQ